MGKLKECERIVYQIYPKSFNDSNNDGIGDLNGITQKLPYLKALGVNTLWLNPIYVSPQIDNGYDVADHYQIEPTLGTLADFDELVAQAHALGLEVILDFVMNHTSDKHPWFQAALADQNSEYRNFYLWRQGKNDGPPNNWASFFGGSVWQKEPATENNYYFHLFAKEMPDLNWQEPRVLTEMVKIAKFWLDHGVDGFRLDAFIHIAKADFDQNMLTTEDKPQLAEMFYANLPQVVLYLQEFITKLREIKPDIFILGEAASADIDLAVTYTTPPQKRCDTVVTFRYFTEDETALDSDLLRIGQPLPLDLTGFKANMLEWQKRLEGVSFPTLYWSNHDMPRILTRFCPKRQKAASAKMLATLMYLQRGIPCIYYGEELGMEAGSLAKLSDFEDQQVLEFAKQAQAKGWSEEQILTSVSRAHKMAARLPMAFDETKYQGFSQTLPWKWAATPRTQAVSTQEADQNSVLAYYRQVLHLKQQAIFIHGRFVLENTDKKLYVYRRILAGNEVWVICNLSATPQTFECGQGNTLLAQNARVVANKVELQAYGSLVLAR